MAKEKTPLSKSEARAAASLGLVVGLRMFGLFLILPVFVLYAEDISGHTPLLIGVAIGIYGLTQAVMQIPMGLLSDYFGRKAIIAIGMSLFIFGSIVAALADNIWMIILGRALQGLGAVASVSMALAADLSRDSQRTKMMAFIGMSIGLSFIIALLLAPVLGNWLGLSGLFWATAVLSFIGLVIFWIWVPQPAQNQQNESPLRHLNLVFQKKALFRLDISVLVLHLILTGIFVVLPPLLEHLLPSPKHWQFYLPAMLISIAFMIPMILFSEKKHLNHSMAALSFVLLGLSIAALLVIPHSFLSVLIILVLFFTAFNFLESTLPAMLSRRVTSRLRGGAMGVYTSSQFFGAFLGGVLGGWLSGFSAQIVFAVISLLAVLMAPVIWGVRQVAKQEEMTLHMDIVDTKHAQRANRALLDTPAIADAVVIPEENLIYLKFVKDALSEKQLRDIIEQAEPLKSV